MSDNGLSDEDKKLFRSMMQTVKPLDKVKKLAEKPAPSPTQSRPKLISTEKPKPNYDLSNYFHDTVNSDAILAYCKQSIPRKRLSQLKGGHIPWEARLDLHGLRPDSARESLCNFIDQQISVAHRCLLIIHGKGGLHGEAPILKNYVNHWLRQLPQILAFHSALPRDGGSGALYVLLKRER